MDTFLRKFFPITPILGVVLGATCIVALPAPAQNVATSQVSSDRLYDCIGHTFWDAENQLRSRVKPFSREPSPYKNPLTRDDALYQKYFYVDKAAGEYLQIIDKAKPQSWTVPPVLYLGGIAAFTIGDHANAQKYFSRLLDQYPQFIHQRSLRARSRFRPPRQTRRYQIIILLPKCRDMACHVRRTNAPNQCRGAACCAHKVLSLWERVG